MRRKLTVNESKRLRKYCEENGGEALVAAQWGICIRSVERAYQFKTMPQGLFKKKLEEIGVIIKENRQ